MSFKTKWVARELERFTKLVPKPTKDYLSDDEYERAQDEWHKAFFAKRQKLWAEEIDEAKAKAYLKAIQDAQAALIRQRVQEGNYEGMPELEELMSQLKNKRGNGGNLHMHYMVTVNCKPDVRVPELVKKVNKYVKRAFVTSAEWVYEQRGAHEGELGKGMHVHILVTQRGDKFDGEFKDSTRNTFKHLVGVPKTHVDIKPVPTKYLGDKRSYMQGVKNGEGKMDKVAMDRVWRPQNKLEHYYTHTNTHGNRQETEGSASTPGRQASSDGSTSTQSESVPELDP